MQNKHSLLPPSSAARRVMCAGSRQLEAMYPKIDTPESEEGHLAHEYAAAILRQGMGFPAFTPTVSKEMHDAVMQYVDKIWEVASYNLHIEERININVIHPECWGTPDCWFFNGGELHIWDLKFGFGRVRAFENWQLIEYAAGIINYLRLGGHDVADLFINFHIVQPRYYLAEYTPNTWRISYRQLQPYFEKLKNAELATFENIPQFVVSPECRYCSARAACTALGEVSAEIVDLSSMPTHDLLKQNKIGEELRRLQDAKNLLEARITGLEEEVVARIRQGESIPLFRIGHTRPRQIWKDPLRAERVIALLGADITKRDVITPKQAIALDVDEALVNALSTSIPGAPKLERINLKDIQELLTK